MSPTGSRPTGVTIIAWLHWIRGALYAIGAYLLLYATRLSGRLMNAIANDTFLTRITSHVGHALAYGLAIFAAFWIIVGIGIWFLKNWARVATIFFSGLWAIFEVIRVLSLHSPWRIFRLAVDGMITLYLLVPSVKRAFR
jgi:hypothetical protein